MVNGAIHTTAVIMENKPHDRHLIYLLQVGAILITSGAIELISGWGLRHKQWWGFATGLLGAVLVIFLCLVLMPVFRAPFMLTIHSLLLVIITIGTFIKRPY